MSSEKPRLAKLVGCSCGLPATVYRTENGGLVRLCSEATDASGVNAVCAMRNAPLVDEVPPSCACGLVMKVRVSHSMRNPDRLYGKCPNNTCRAYQFLDVPRENINSSVITCCTDSPSTRRSQHQFGSPQSPSQSQNSPDLSLQSLSSQSQPSFGILNFALPSQVDDAKKQNSSSLNDDFKIPPLFQGVEAMDNLALLLRLRKVAKEIIETMTQELEKVEKRVEEVRKKSRPEKEEEDWQCSICLERRVSHAMIPCGHMFCEVCSTQYVNIPCPRCRTTITSSLRTYN